MFDWNLPALQETGATLDAQRFRRALGAFPTGVCLVTTMGLDGRREGMTINSFASVSLSPPLILWSLRDAARSAESFIAAPGFAIQVLHAGQRELAQHFSRAGPDKFDAWQDHFTPGLRGCPIVADAVATYECRTYSRHPEGDHTVLIGRVERFDHEDRPPLMFHAGTMGSVHELAVADMEKAAGLV